MIFVLNLEDRRLIVVKVFVFVELFYCFIEEMLEEVEGVGGIFSFD